ncbi:putative proline-specific permease [Hypoxylon sp. FL0890]|nr:putative proline-specific permease [Hypoxylon sp. FL0890]
MAHAASDSEKDPGMMKSSDTHYGDDLQPTDSTRRGLKSRHAQMIALGGTIGTGLFVGAGQGLHRGGPATLLIAYIVITLLLFGVATATGEMSAYMPVPGCSMAYYGNRFGSKSIGVTMGWVYWYIFAITVPAEITATHLVIGYWNPPLPTAFWLTIIGIVIISLNLFPVKVYGETEFWFASIKVFAIIGLLLLTVVLFFGGGPSHQPLWFSNWNDPAPMKSYIVEGGVGRLVGFIATLVFSVYAFAFAPELLVITGGEMDSPRRNLPKASRRYFYRLIIFYVFGVLAIGILVNSNNPGLLGGTNDAGSSPWALGIKVASISGLDSVVNVIIVLSAWSAGNSYLYLASRALYSIAEAGNAPKIFTRCTKSGIPIYATAMSASVSALAYMNVSSSSATVFNWFINIINTGAFQSWIFCCFIYFRYRKATAVQGIPTASEALRADPEPYAAWVSMIGFTILLLLNGFTVFIDGQWNVETFISAYIGIPITIAIYTIHKCTAGRHDPWLTAPEDIDLHTGIMEVALQENPAPVHDKWYHKWRAIFE